MKREKATENTGQKQWFELKRNRKGRKSALQVLS